MAPDKSYDIQGSNLRTIYFWLTEELPSAATLHSFVSSSCVYRGQGRTRFFVGLPGLFFVFSTTRLRKGGELVSKKKEQWLSLCRP